MASSASPSTSVRAAEASRPSRAPPRSWPRWRRSASSRATHPTRGADGPILWPSRLLRPAPVLRPPALLRSGSRLLRPARLLWRPALLPAGTPLLRARAGLLWPAGLLPLTGGTPRRETGQQASRSAAHRTMQAALPTRTVPMAPGRAPCPNSPTAKDSTSQLAMSRHRLPASPAAAPTRTPGCCHRRRDPAGVEAARLRPLRSAGPRSLAARSRS
jgi:hypothetical protein